MRIVRCKRQVLEVEHGERSCRMVYISKEANEHPAA